MPTENVCQKFFFLADDFTCFLFRSFTAFAFVLQILPQTAIIAGFMFFKGWTYTIIFNHFFDIFIISISLSLFIYWTMIKTVVVACGQLCLIFVYSTSWPDATYFIEKINDFTKYGNKYNLHRQLSKNFRLSLLYFDFPGTAEPVVFLVIFIRVPYSSPTCFALVSCKEWKKIPKCCKVSFFQRHSY